MFANGEPYWLLAAAAAEMSGDEFTSRRARSRGGDGGDPDRDLSEEYVTLNAEVTT